MQANKTSLLKITLIVLYAISFLFVGAFAFAGCGTMYTSRPGTLEQMKGTYKLTTYTQKDSEKNEVNRITQWHVKAYVVVGTDGHGYYAYQDDNTEFWYDTISIQYNKDDQNAELFKSIRFTTGVGTVTINKQKPGCGSEPTMGFNVNTNTFNYFIPDDTPSQSWLYPSYYTDVVYTKISDDTDLTKIASEFNTTLNVLPKYELKNLDGVLIFHAGQVNTERAGDVTNPEYGKYKYYVVDFDAKTEKANIYYELVEGSAGAQTQTNVQLDVRVEQSTQNEYNQRYVIVKFFNKDFVGSSSDFSAPVRFLNYEVNTPFDESGTSYQIYANWFEKYYGDKTNINDIVADQLDAYNNSLI